MPPKEGLIGAIGRSIWDIMWRCLLVSRSLSSAAPWLSAVRSDPRGQASSKFRPPGSVINEK